MDLDGDGRPDLVVYDGLLPGSFSRTIEQGWSDYTAFNSLPQVNWSDPNLRFADLTGDGLADVLITSDDLYTLQPRYRDWV